MNLSSLEAIFAAISIYPDSAGSSLSGDSVNTLDC